MTPEQKAAIVTKAAKHMIEDPASNSIERRVLGELLTLGEFSQAVFYDALQYAVGRKEGGA